MRIIAGQFKGRRLKSLQGTNTRPTSDKVKEAVFHMIGPFFSGGTCLDLFAGSGALGIEAVSRGMDKAIFVDYHGGAIRTIYENVKEVEIEKRVEIMRMDGLRALRVTQEKGFRFDLILLDPPYQKSNIHKMINKIIQLQLLSNHGVIVCEHDSSIQLSQVKELEIMKQSTYGSTAVTIYKSNL